MAVYYPHALTRKCLMAAGVATTESREIAYCKSCPSDTWCDTNPLDKNKQLLTCSSWCPTESDDDIFEQIDKMTLEREWAAIPPPPPTAGLCGLCLPRFSAPAKKPIPKVWS